MSIDFQKRAERLEYALRRALGGAQGWQDDAKNLLKLEEPKVVYLTRTGRRFHAWGSSKICFEQNPAYNGREELAAHAGGATFIRDFSACGCLIQSTGDRGAVKQEPCRRCYDHNH